MVDRVLNFLERWRGIPVLVGVALILLNFIVGFFPWIYWLNWHSWLLHLGLVVAFVGLLLTEAL